MNYQLIKSLFCLSRYRGNGGEQQHMPQHFKNRYWVNHNAHNGHSDYSNGIVNVNNANNNLKIKGKLPGDNLKKPQWDVSALMPFEKDFYQPHEDVQNRYVFLAIEYMKFSSLMLFIFIVVYLKK